MIQAIEDVRGAAITVAGLGTHGGAIGNIRWLHEAGARLTVTDLKTAAELQESLKQLEDLPDIVWVLGEHREQDFTEADCVIRNPAVPAGSPWLEAARAAGVPVEMDSSLLLKLSPTRDIIGVTGSKGKTTTTLAIGHVLGAAGRVHVVGVEGTSPLAILSDVQKDDTIVFELSSWRLEALAEHGLSPATAVITALYRDHLNTYASWEAYEAAKQAIVRSQRANDVALLNADDARVQTWASWVPSRAVWYGLKPPTGEAIYIDGDQVLRRQAETTIELDVQLPPRLRGAHQRRNVLPAIWLGLARGLAAEAITERLAELPAPPHRLELVCEVDGVAYVNDSAATIPEATIAALATYAAQPLVLIAGGGDKGLEFEELADRIRRAHVRGVVLLPGTATPRLQEALQAAGVTAPIHEAASMPAAVAAARQLAQRGDAVLLSPGATSFGLFRHEFDRGDQFRTAALAVGTVS